MPNNAQIKICWIVYNSVHYHVARLRSLALDRQLNILLLQLLNNDVFQELSSGQGNECVQIETVAPGRKRGFVRPHELGQALTEKLSQLDPAIVCVNGWGLPGSITALKWCVTHQRKAIMMSESTCWDSSRYPWQESIKRFLLGHCGAMLCGGQSHEEYAIKLGMPVSCIFKGYDAVDNDYFSKAALEAQHNNLEIKSELSLPQAYFLACSRFTEKKNLISLIKAFACYRESLQASNLESGWSLVLLGDGPLRSEIEQEIHALNLTAFVHLPGFSDYATLPKYYALASAFVHASTTEQWGLVVNEAMACGLPVLVSERCGCAQDLVCAGVNGQTFDPYSVEAIAKALQSMASITNSDRQVMGDASRTTIADWGPARFASGLTAAVQKAMSPGKSKPSFIDILLLRLLCLIRP